jgi:hypothetical protein
MLMPLTKGAARGGSLVLRRAWQSALGSTAASLWAEIRALKVHVWKVEGAEKWSGLPISMLFAGSQRNRAYLRHLLVQNSFRESLLGTSWIWNVSKFLPQVLGCSVVALAVQKRQLKYLLFKPHFFIPAWIDTEIDLPPEKRLTKGKRFTSDLVKIRKQGWQYELGNGTAAVEDFYDNYYKPYIGRVHAASNFMVSREVVKARAPDCELLWLKKEGSVLAAQLIVREAIRPRLWCLGVRDGDAQHVKDGAHIAACHFSLDYLAKQGYRKASLGWTRAFLRDGVLSFKNRWSPRIINSTFEGFALSFPSCSKATQSFLLNNPFIHQKSGALHSALFVSSETPSRDVLQKPGWTYHYEGISKQVRYRVPGVGPAPKFQPAHEGT